MSSHLNASLFRLKLIDALRAGDAAKVDSLVQNLRAVDSTVDNRELIQLRDTILHFAVQVSPLSLVQSLVQNKDYNLDINAQDSDGNTPLHLAVYASRFNVVKYLMGLPDINDTVLNNDKNQPVELARDANVAQLMQLERAKFVEVAATNLRKYFSNRDFNKLEDLMVNNARAAELLDINGADPETGNTVLHEFIAKEDLQMCEWILKHGGDPFKRDIHGKLPIDLVAHKSDPIRRLLKSASKDQNMMEPTSTGPNGTVTGGAPTYKGYLRKWTNFASGYKLRYFVLDQYGILSYYTNQNDTKNACRGSINLGYATLHLDSSEKLKFEIIGKNGIKWHLKANHPVETNRWVWTLQNATTISKDAIRKGNAKPHKSRISVDDASLRLTEDIAPVSEEEEKKRRLLHIPGRRRLHKKTPSQVSVASFTSDVDETSSLNSFDNQSRQASTSVNNAADLPQINEKAAAASRISIDHYAVEDFDDDLDGSGDSDAGSLDLDTPEEKASNEQMFSTKRSLLIEISSLSDLFKALGSGSPESSIDSDTYRVGSNTLNNMRLLFELYDTLMQKREAKLVKKIERQQEVNKLWESSIRQLEGEIQKHEETLAQYEGKKYKLRKLLESKGISSPQVNNELASGVMEKGSSFGPTTESSQEDNEDTEILNDFLYNSDDEFFDADDFDDAHDATVEDPAPETEQSQSDSAPPAASAIVTSSKSLDGIQGKLESELQKAKQEQLQEEGSFLGYEQPPRQKLAMDEDNRPKVGLWGILKSMIGQDMTKMTLPVCFNECTSLLQRLAEDIEYNDLLTKAASIDDSTLRLVFVAVFAASEYASTTNRIAKPFNPLLGETFEYARPDQNFRLLTEQVSHHPPISACHAESAKWDYFGENAVDPQFRGRSFDVKHLGKMFCTLRPDSGVMNKKGEKVFEEFYSWKKVNTSVIGIITGSPSVDNFGTMEVRNHTTGDVIHVEMKQRGWKASSAYQLSGIVTDAKGASQWAIGGHWNSKIFAKKVSADYDSKKKDSLTEGEEHSSDYYSGSRFLVWQAAPRPKVPFNLTSFAVTLNDLNDNLKQWLAPTDTRWRPDQRAMEDGRYDDAAREKTRVENKQRAAKKVRDQNRQTYKPNWFVKLKHPVTGDPYWHYNGDYWTRRKNHKLVGTGDIY